MHELSGPSSPRRHRERTVAVARVAARQHGVVGWGQLRELGVPGKVVSSWVRLGRLIPIHPRAYAVGHDHLDDRGRVVAALLYAGKGAALSHTTGTWHWKLLDARPARIHVSAPKDVQSRRDVVVHHPRQLSITTHLGLPVTTVGRTLVDVGGMVPAGQLAKAVANASYRGLLDPSEAISALRRGRRGSAALRIALSHLLPELARTLSPLEDLFVLRCDAAGLPAPAMNRNVLGMKIDAVWRDQKIAVELDGGKAHGHAVAVHVDRARDLKLRNAGWIILRYSRLQIESEWPLVLAELRRFLHPIDELSALDAA